MVMRPTGQSGRGMKKPEVVSASCAGSSAARRPPCSGMGYRPTAAPPWVGGQYGQRFWLVVERLPAHAPELNLLEGRWPAARPSSSPTSVARPWPSDRPGPPRHRAGPPDTTSGLSGIHRSDNWAGRGNGEQVPADLGEWR